MENKKYSKDRAHEELKENHCHDMKVDFMFDTFLSSWNELTLIHISLRTTETRIHFICLHYFVCFVHFSLDTMKLHVKLNFSVKFSHIFLFDLVSIDAF